MYDQLKTTGGYNSPYGVASNALDGIGHSAAGTHSFENAVTTATLALTAVCAALVTWAARRTARVSAK
jgi:hypothetical protein